MVGKFLPNGGQESELLRQAVAMDDHQRFPPNDPFLPARLYLPKLPVLANVVPPSGDSGFYT